MSGAGRLLIVLATLTPVTVGCAHRRFSQAEKLPQSVLRQSVDDGNATQTANDPADKSQALANDQAELPTFSDLPVIEITDEEFQQRDRSGERRVRSVLKAPSDERLPRLPRRMDVSFPTDSTQRQANDLNIRRGDKVEQRIRGVLRDLEQVDPDAVETFIDASRSATTSEELERLLNVWQTTIEYRMAGRNNHPTNTQQSADLRTGRDSMRLPTAISSPGGGQLPQRLAVTGGSVYEAHKPNPRSHTWNHESTRSAGETSRAQPIPQASSGATRRLQYSESDAASQTQSGIAPAVASAAATTSTHYVSQDGPITWSDVEARARALAQAFEQLDTNETDDTLRAQAYNRLLYLIANENRRAQKPISAADTVDRKFWQSLIWGLSQYFDDRGIPRSVDRAQAMIESLEESVAALGQRADLEISDPLLCSSVINWGNFTEFDQYEFAPGQSVVAYWEARNFMSVETREGFRTQLDASFTIYDSMGNKRHEFDRPFPDDVCANRRHDYFMVRKFSWPRDLPPGEYILEVTVTDKTANKIASKKVRFKIVSRTR